VHFFEFKGSICNTFLEQWNTRLTCVDLLGCAGHQQNAKIAGKITIMRESFCPSRQISKGSRVKAAKHQTGSGSLRYHAHSRRILLAI
jgi:hypothetical protein